MVFQSGQCWLNPQGSTNLQSWQRTPRNLITFLQLSHWLRQRIVREKLKNREENADLDDAKLNFTPNPEQVRVVFMTMRTFPPLNFNGTMAQFHPRLGTLFKKKLHTSDENI